MIRSALYLEGGCSYTGWVESSSKETGVGASSSNFNFFRTIPHEPALIRSLQTGVDRVLRDGYILRICKTTVDSPSSTVASSLTSGLSKTSSTFLEGISYRSIYNSVTIDAHLCSPQYLEKLQYIWHRYQPHSQPALFFWTHVTFELSSNNKVDSIVM